MLQVGIEPCVVSYHGMTASHFIYAVAGEKITFSVDVPAGVDVIRCVVVSSAQNVCNS